MADEKIRIEIEVDVNEQRAKAEFQKIETQGRAAGLRAGGGFGAGFGNKVGSSFKNVFGGVFGRLGAQVATLGAALGAAFATRGVIRAGATIERIETQFGVLLGSAAAAQKQIQSLTDFAARTPFRLEGLADTSAKLLAFGVPLDQVNEKLAQIGDVAAGSNSDLGELGRIFGQVSAATRLTGERLLQLEERAVPIGPAIARTLGVAESSVRELVKAGKISDVVFQKAFKSLTEAGGAFENATEKQSRTIGGLLSTLEDNFFALQVAISKAFGPIFKAVVRESIKVLQDLTKSFKENSKSIALGAIQIGRVINDFVVPPFVALKRIASIAFQSIVVGANATIAAFANFISIHIQRLDQV